jgi:hypothetical protein
VKKFIKVPQGMSQQQIQNINIKNIIAGPARRLKRRTKKVVPIYSKKIAKGDEMEKSVIKTEGGLPAYVFTPQKKFLSIGDLTTKDDTSNDKLINLLKGAFPVIAEGAKKLALPAPEQKFLLGDVEKEFIIDMIEGQLIEAEPVVRELIRRETMPKKPIPPSLPKPEKPSPRPTPITTPIGTPLREEEFTMPESFPQKPPESIPVEEPSAFKETFDVKKVFRIRYLKGLDKEDKKFTKFIDSQKNSEGKTIDPASWNAETLINFGNLIGLELKKGTKKDILQKEIAKKLQGGAGTDNGDEGLYNDQIEKIMKKRIKNFVPVVASDKVNDLLQYVNKGDKFFSAVINTEPSESFGRHWRCIVIDNRDDYPSAEYFDSLAENAKPDDALLSVMRKICKRMNPEKYFKFKYNMLRRQSFNTSNCSYHVMKFIEDRHNGIPFEDASGWSDYMKHQKGNGYEPIDDSQDGEGDLASYQNKIKKLFKSYL